VITYKAHYLEGLIADNDKNNSVIIEGRMTAIAVNSL
jgi:hypothetical protein